MTLIAERVTRNSKSHSLLYLSCRGETFRREFANIGEVRSLIPDSVHLMALTATATVKTRNAICKTLGLVKPVIIAVSPNKPNIKYIVRADPGTLEEGLAYLVEEIKRYRHLTDRTIIFCRTYDSMSHMYLFFRSRLKKEMFEPIGAPDLARFRIVDMFSACTHRSVKEAIINSFSDPSSHLRIVIATIAFGMGIDCPNVRRVIHWGPSDDIEQYLQESGRAGRDQLSAYAILYKKAPSVVVKGITENMKEYCSNIHECRRKMLLKHFDTQEEENFQQELCTCCDVCERNCICSTCTYKV